MTRTSPASLLQCHVVSYVYLLEHRGGGGRETSQEGKDDRDIVSLNDSLGYPARAVVRNKQQAFTYSHRCHVLCLVHRLLSTNEFSTFDN